MSKSGIVFHTSQVDVFMACELERLGYEARFFERSGEPYVCFNYKP